MPVIDSRETFEVLFRNQAEKLRRMAFCFLHDESSAEDAVQETFSRGLAFLHTFRSESRPEVWLYSVCLNVCRQAYRKARIQEQALTGPAAAKSRGRRVRGPLSSLLRRETAARLAIALGYLTDLQREVFVLHYVEELPYEEIAPLLGVSVVGARGLAQRAKDKLKKKVPAGFALPGD
jgi:RNA polymerase sigma-70 factor (ECF subfamily)